MSEVKNRQRFDSFSYVVDEKYLLEIKKKARINEETIENLAEKKFQDYLAGMNPINLEFRIRGVEELVGHSVITELNYGERGWPLSVPEEIKYAIANEITGYVEKKFEHYKEDCRMLFEKMHKRGKERYEKKN